jgi:glutamate carboxypeptidase
MITDSLERAERRLAQLVDDALRLIECESPSNDLAALERSAALVAEIGADYLGQLPEIIRHGDVPHLRWRLGNGPRRVLVLGHHDTVWPLGSLERIPAVVTVQDDGSRIMRGPGCFDMLAGVMQAFAACAVLRERGDDLDGVTVLITGDEEVGSPSSRALIEAEAAGARACFVLEASGTGGALKTERKGVGRFRLDVTGRAAHSGLDPERGVNAGLELALHLPDIAGLAELEAGTTVVPTSGRIGTAANTVPAHAFVDIDVRARSLEELQRVERALHSLRPHVDGAIVTVDGGINRPPLEASASAELFARATELAARAGRTLTGIAVGGASDGNFTAALGVPTLDGLGAVGDGAHADHEHVLVDEIPWRTALLAELIREV